MTDPRLTVIPDHDYGEDKTREQENAVAMLAVVMLAAIVWVFGAAVGILIGHYLL